MKLILMSEWTSECLRGKKKKASVHRYSRHIVLKVTWQKGKGVKLKESCPSFEKARLKFWLSDINTYKLPHWLLPCLLCLHSPINLQDSSLYLRMCQIWKNKLMGGKLFVLLSNSLCFSFITFLLNITLNQVVKVANANSMVSLSLWFSTFS